MVSHGTVELLMHRANLQGVTGRPRWRRARPDLLAKDLADRQFSRSGPNQLAVTDITEHHTREGKLYCAVVLDVYSRRVVGWSIDAFEYLEFCHNRRRRHSALGWISPLKFENRSKIVVAWKSSHPTPRNPGEPRESGQRVSLRVRRHRLTGQVPW